jgi:predicted flap endonuclease-1-like 5' DNA nuclease
MTELLWQTIFLLAGAFFFGAVLACGLKRRFYYGPSAGRVATGAVSVASGAAPAPDASQPKIEVQARAKLEGERFERALSGASSASAVPAAPSQLVVPPTNVKVEPVKAPEPAPAPKPAPKPAPAAVPEPAPKPAPATAAAPTPAPAPPQPEMAGIPRVSVSSGSGAPAPVEEGGIGPSDDLTRIQGIDSIMQGRLKELGIRRFQDLAGLTSRDVKGLSETLGLDARVSLENWIGQAQVLAVGGETYYSRRIDQGVPVPEAAVPATPAPAPQAAAPPQPAPAPTPAPAPAAAPAGGNGSPVSDVAHLRSVRSEALIGEEGARAQGRPFSDFDDLKRIRGIGVLIEKKLNSLGITHYEQVANWTGADIERFSRILDFKGRIEREHWIEQARILATGGQTEFSRRN